MPCWMAGIDGYLAVISWLANQADDLTMRLSRCKTRCEPQTHQSGTTNVEHRKLLQGTNWSAY